MGWVKREDGSWLVFDDDLVSESSWEFVQGLKGGGDEHMSRAAVWKSTSELGCHRADVATETTSRRCRGAPENWISTQVLAILPGQEGGNLGSGRKVGYS